jgi:hypothetical protein
MGELAILKSTIKALREFDLTVEEQAMPRAADGLMDADAWLRVKKNREKANNYVVEIKRTVTPATLGATVAQLHQFAEACGRIPLLVTTHVTPPVAQRLRGLDQQFADTAGNAYLTGPGFLVFVVGRKPEGKPLPQRRDRLFTTAGVKVLFALICDPDLAMAPHRTIAATADVALGTIPAVLGEMNRRGYLLVTGRNRRLNATRRLLDDWALAYARTLRPKTLLATYTTPNFAGWANWKLPRGKARWGGEPAANLLVRFLKPGVLTIYADKPPARLIVEQRWTVTETPGAANTVEIRKPFWGETLRPDGEFNTVPPALIYADLLATGDARCIETAQMVYDGYLAQLFPAA